MTFSQSSTKNNAIFLSFIHPIPWLFLAGLHYYFLLSTLYDTLHDSKYYIRHLFLLNFHHCTFPFITAHFVHHCTLKQALTWCRPILINLFLCKRQRAWTHNNCFILPHKGERNFIVRHLQCKVKYSTDHSDIHWCDIFTIISSVCKLVILDQFRLDKRWLI